MKKSNWRVVLTSLFVMGACAVWNPTLAEARRGRGHEDMAERLTAELNLTAEQKDKLKVIQEEYQKNLPSKKEAMGAAHEELNKLLQSGATDDEIRKKFQELQLKQSEFAQARFEKVLAIRAILTPEQRQKFKGWEERFHKGMRGDRKWKKSAE